MMYLSVSPLNPQSVEYKLASCCYISYGDSPGDIGMSENPWWEGLNYAEYQALPGAQWIGDSAPSNTVGTTDGLPAGYVHPRDMLEAQAVDNQFTSQNTLGTAGYSQDMAGYLNALSPAQLVGLGDSFDVSGLARSDLMSGFGEGYTPTDPRGYSTADQYIMSKYRNIDGYRDTGNQTTGDRYGYGQVFEDYDQTLEGGPTAVGLWGTRNIDNPTNERYSGGNTLYGYGDDGSFNQLAARDRSGFSESLLNAAPYIMGALATAGLGAGMSAGAAGIGGGGAAGGAVGTGSGLGMGGAATGAAGGLGSSTSLISGAGSLGLGGSAGYGAGLGSGLAGAAGAGGAGLGSSVGLAYGGALGSGVGAGLGAASSYGAGAGALTTSPSFSLINGANALNLGNVATGRYALPDSLQSLDMSTDWVDLAKKGKKIYDQLSGGQSGAQPQAQAAGQQSGFQGLPPGGSERNALRPTPYQYQDQGTANAVRGYRDYLRS